MSDDDLPIAEMLPGLLRIATTAVRRSVDWAVRSATTATRDVARSIADGEPPIRIAIAVTAPLRDVVREVPRLVDPPDEPDEPAPIVHRRPGATVEELRTKGAQLLYDSADVWLQHETHPAYARILEELSPDEARILRLLALEGPQPAIDIRTNRPLGVGSELVEGGLSMVGLHAGVRNQARTRADLSNLYRLGLVWFSREQVADPSRYQVVEVQPEVTDAVQRAGRSHKTVYRSIELTDFGKDFCEVCLPLG